MAGAEGYRAFLDYHGYSGSDRIGNIKIEIRKMHKIKGISLDFRLAVY
jgi:hypothetical protein